MAAQYWKKGDYTCSTDKTKLQIEIIHHFLSEMSYWAKGRTIEKIKISIENSVCFGIYKKDKLVGFARVISDFTIYGYILDVFVLEDERGNGLGKWLMHCIMNHPKLMDVQRWMLGTEDAHGLYEKYGFTSLKNAQIHMEKVT